MICNYSIIIRTKNSGKTIKACLDSILKQSVLPSKIIIVDSGSNDDTISIIKGFDVTLIHYPRDIEFNYSKALNIGIEKVNTAYVLILSSHVAFLNDTTIELMLNELSNKNCITVSMSRTDNKNQIDTLEHIKKEIFTLDNFKGKAMFNFCSMIRKDSWLEYPFNDKIPTCEDQDWAFNFLKKGFFTEIILEPRVFYNNPYYNVKKDVFETITIGRTVYPFFVSKKYMLQMFKIGIKKIIAGKRASSKFNLLMAWHIFKYRYFALYHNKSLYNKNLN